MRPFLFALLAAVAVSACTSNEEEGTDELVEDTTAVSETPVVADPGLSPAQRDSLLALGYPVLVPTDPGEFHLDSVRIEMDPAFYALTYGRDDSTCVTITGASEGIGGPGLPMDSMIVDVPALSRGVSVHRAGPNGEEADTWGAGAIVSNWIEIDRMHANVISRDEGACRGLSLDEAATFIGGLRRLDGAAE
jgi:hypothetical protein